MLIMFIYVYMKVILHVYQKTIRQKNTYTNARVSMISYICACIYTYFTNKFLGKLQVNIPHNDQQSTNSHGKRERKYFPTCLSVNFPPLALLFYFVFLSSRLV